MSRSYSRDEAQAILARAVERQHGASDQLTHEELLGIARELGVSGESFEAAAAGIGDAVVVEREVNLRVMRARRGFLFHLVPFLLVNLLLVTVNVMTTSFLWFLFPLLAWGVGLGSHALAALSPDREKIAEKVRRRLEREREKERRRNERGSLQAGARRVASVVQDRTADMLHAVADALENAVPPADPKVRVDPPVAERRAPSAARVVEDELHDEDEEGEASRRRGAG